MSKAYYAAQIVITCRFVQVIISRVNSVVAYAWVKQLLMVDFDKIPDGNSHIVAESDDLQPRVPCLVPASYPVACVHEVSTFLVDNVTMLLR